MKEIFVVDDNPGKLADLAKSAKQLFPQAEVREFVCSHSMIGTILDQQTILKAEPNEYLMIIDMQMPPYVGGRVNVDGGLEVIGHLRRLHLSCPAIIASSESLTDRQTEEAEQYEAYKGFLRYSVWVSSTSEMRELLQEYLPDETQDGE